MTAESFKKELLENILPFWKKMLGDGLYFPGRIDGLGNVHPESEKSAVMIFRMLWAFSSTARVTGSEDALECAHKIYRWACDHFIDNEMGGVYWSTNADGSPLDTKKQSYAIGFAIYGLSEYYMVSEAEEAKELARSLFNDLETHAWDELHGGYVEALTKDWQPLEDMRLSDKDMNTVFSMNTHLHILEPYTNLYRICPDKEIETAIGRLLSIFTDRLLDKDGKHLGLFFDENWTRLDSIISYGHDIEASWLVDEALQVSGISHSKAENLVKDVAEAVLPAVAEDGHLANEKDIDKEETDWTAIWWGQAEAVTGFMNMYSISKDTRYLKASEDAWNYIQNNIIDRQGGEWFWSVSPDGVINTADDKAGFWKCPYHDSRMCLEMIRRVNLELNR